MPKGHETFFQSSVMRPWGGMVNGLRDGGEMEEAVAEWKATQRFERAPKQRSSFFQLCDLEDDVIQRHLEGQPVTDTCDVSGGAGGALCVESWFRWSRVPIRTRLLLGIRFEAHKKTYYTRPDSTTRKPRYTFRKSLSEVHVCPLKMSADFEWADDGLAAS